MTRSRARHTERVERELRENLLSTNPFNTQSRKPLRNKRSQIYLTMSLIQMLDGHTKRLENFHAMFPALIPSEPLNAPLSTSAFQFD